jgi:hypothetical protein
MQITAMGCDQQRMALGIMQQSARERAAHSSSGQPRSVEFAFFHLKREKGVLVSSATQSKERRTSLER